MKHVKDIWAINYKLIKNLAHKKHTFNQSSVF